MEKNATAGDHGRQVLGLGLIFMAAVWLKWGDFSPGQDIPEWFPDHKLLAYIAAVFTLVVGAAIEWRRTAAWGAAALGIYYVLVVVILMDGPGLVAYYSEYGSYSGIAEQLAIAAASLIIFAKFSQLNAARAARLNRLAQQVFGMCAVLFGGAHFFYLNLTVPLIPDWLPPSQLFWAYATGVGHIAAGIAILTGIKARLAAILLTAMYVSFTLLVHMPIVLRDPRIFFSWTENALNLALIGAAWVVADSLREAGAPGRRGEHIEGRAH